jgi:PAS domain S-box-containing protein
MDPASSPSILVVEDERIVARDIERSLVTLGYRVAGKATRGEEAVAMASELHPDLVLMDIRLAGHMDGIAAAAAIRAERETPVVYLTAYSDASTLERAKDTEPFGFLVKPFRETELRAAIEVALRRHRAETSATERARVLESTPCPTPDECPDTEALHAFAARLARIIATSADAIVAVGDDLCIAVYNRAAEETFGWSSDEALGRPVADLFPKRDRARMNERLRGLAFEGAMEAVRPRGRHERVCGLRKDGEEFTAEASMLPLDVGGTKLVTVVIRDEAAHERSEDEQRFLAEVGVFLARTLDYDETLTGVAELAVRQLADFCVIDVIEADGRIRRVTVAHADPQDAVLARTLRDVRLDRRRPQLTASAIEKGPLLVPRVDEDFFRAVTQSEEHLQALLALTPRSVITVPLNARGHCLGALALIAARGSRPYAARDLALAKELARRAALAIDNARAHDQAREAIAARDDVLGVVAHDLRNPLNSIQLWASALQDDEPGSVESTPTAPRDVADRIVRCAERAERLTRDLLDVTRIESGHLTLARERLSTLDLLRDGVEAVRPLATTAEVELQVEAPSEIRAVDADRSRVLQVLDNLAGNAVKFSPRGRRVVVGVAAAGDEVVFRVKDEGPGIPPDQIPNLFDRYWQARRADRRGLGLGLAISKAIVEAHGGRIWVESEAGAGSTFFFTLPGA